MTSEFKFQEKIISLNPNLSELKKKYPKALEMVDLIRAMYQDVQHAYRHTNKKFQAQRILTGLEGTLYASKNSLYDALMGAYNNHEDVVLEPEVVLLHVLMNMSKHIHKNPDRFKTKLVKEGADTKLTVVEVATQESKWDNFFPNMLEEIKKNTNPGVADLFVPTFSNTDDFHCICLATALMDTCKNYFEYEREITRCGIRNVIMRGTLQDWESVREKLQRTIPLMKDHTWEKYMEGVDSILGKWVETYQEKPDVEFWNRMAHVKGTHGSGVPASLSGWIIELFIENVGEQKVDLPSISLAPFVVPVKLKNELTHSQKDCYATGGLVGLDIHNGAHRPLMSLCIFEDVHSIETLQTSVQ